MMKNLIVDGQEMDRIAFDNPSYEDVLHYFSQLNGKTPCVLRLENMSGNIIIYSSATDRMQLQLAITKNEQIFWGILLDTDAEELTKVDIVLENGQKDTYPLQKTVSRSTARDILTHFYENDTVPNGLNWEGDMSEFY